MTEPEKIFDIMSGYSMMEEESRIGRFIQEKFVAGSECDEQYDRIYDARVRLGKHLGTDEEDSDVLEMVDCCENVIRCFCYRIYCHPSLSQSIEDVRRYIADEASKQIPITEGISYTENEKDCKRILEASIRLKERLYTKNMELDIEVILRSYQSVFCRMAEKMYDYRRRIDGNPKTSTK